MTDLPNFAQFMARIRAGDDQAATDLVKQYEPLVRREIRVHSFDQRLSRMVDPADICQSIWSSFFVRLSAGQYDLENATQLTKLLIVMARNKLASQARKQKAHKRDVNRLLDHGDRLHELPQSTPSPSTHIATQELFQKVHDYMTEEERAISELRRSGSTWEAIAAQLGGTAQSRRMQLDRAADRVIQQLGLHDDD
jgi:RNA polymerase sigma factor (sigma-70 family)